MSEEGGIQIAGVRQKEGAITHGAVLHTVEEIIKDIQENKAEYFTNKDGQRAKVYVITRGGKTFLTTSQDDVKPNNLDALVQV